MSGITASPIVTVSVKYDPVILRSGVRPTAAVNATPVLRDVDETVGLNVPGGQGFGRQPDELRAGSKRSPAPVSIARATFWGGVPTVRLIT